MYSPGNGFRPMLVLFSASRQSKDAKVMSNNKHHLFFESKRCHTEAIFKGVVLVLD